MPKASLRENMLARRRHLSADTCLLWSRQAQQRVADSAIFQHAQTLALYSPINNEVFTEALFFLALETGKRVAYPRIRNDSLEFVRVDDRQSLQHGRFGILEPSGREVLPVAELDLLILPGVAFDRRGHRLGYGKGFYDRTLHRAATRSLLIGLCFEFQRVDVLPDEGHDVPMHFVATEAGFYPIVNNPDACRAHT